MKRLIVVILLLVAGVFAGHTTAAADSSGGGGAATQSDFFMGHAGTYTATHFSCGVFGLGISGFLQTSDTVSIGTKDSGYMSCRFKGNSPAPTTPVTVKAFACSEFSHVSEGPRNTYTAFPNGTVSLICYYPAG
jgi:hypothetical protein